VHDRVGRDEFPLPQAFVARMLAVRRSTVTAVARERCRLVRDEFDRLLGVRVG